MVVIIAGLGGYFNIIGLVSGASAGDLFIICLKKNASSGYVVSVQFPDDTVLTFKYPRGE